MQENLLKNRYFKIGLSKSHLNSLTYVQNYETQEKGLELVTSNSSGYKTS